MERLLKKYALQSIASELRRNTLPAIAFSLGEERATRSVFGGAPLVPAGFVWPTCTPPPSSDPQNPGVSAPRDPVPQPLDFLLQIDLVDLRPFGLAAGLPPRGLLTFFYDTENQPWGFDPADRGGFRVALFEDRHLAVLDPPHRALARRGLNFARGETLPHFRSRAYNELAAKVELKDSYFELVEELEGQAYQGGGRHRLFGHSANVQGDMQLEAQLVSNGVNCGDSSGYDEPRARSLAPGAADWVLLLQLDSDDRANIMWGDAGMLYFWIRRQDLAELRFDRAWFALQCG